MLTIHGTSTFEENIEAIWLVKDYLILNGRANNVQMTKPMMKKCKESRVQWEEDLMIQHELPQKEEDEKRVAASKSEEQETEKEEKKQVQKDRETIQTGINIWGLLMRAGQQKLEDLTKMARVSLIAASAKISSGMKQKGELEKELQFLNEKLLKISWVVFLWTARLCVDFFQMVTWQVLFKLVLLHSRYVQE